MATLNGRVKKLERLVPPAADPGTCRGCGLPHVPCTPDRKLSLCLIRAIIGPIAGNTPEAAAALVPARADHHPEARGGPGPGPPARLRVPGLRGHRHHLPAGAQGAAPGPGMSGAN